MLPASSTNRMKLGRSLLGGSIEYLDGCVARARALNHALRGIPQDKIRFHTCYSTNIAPRVHDFELRHFVDLMLQVRAAGDGVHPDVAWAKLRALVEGARLASQRLF